MALPTRTKSARMDAERALIDAGTGNGRLEFLAADGTTILVSITLSKPCGSTSNTDTLTLTGSLSAAALAAGTIASGRLVDSAGTLVRPVAVGTSGAEVNFASGLVITQAGQTITVSSATIKHAA